MLGSLVNAVVIVVCSLAGCFFLRGIPVRFENSIKKAIGLAVIFVGIKGALENQRPLLLIMSLVLGAVIGELIDIDRLMNRFGAWAERKAGAREGVGEAEQTAGADALRTVERGGAAADNAAHGEGMPQLPAEALPPLRHNFSKGFVSASILFCSGSMAIVGAMQGGLAGNHEILFAKSILDGAISVVFGASLGIGTAFSAIPVLLYQGGIALLAGFAGDYLSGEMIREMSAAGSLVIAAIGFNFLEVKEIKVANLIPAVFIPPLYLCAERFMLP